MDNLENNLVHGYLTPRSKTDHTNSVVGDYQQGCACHSSLAILRA